MESGDLVYYIPFAGARFEDVEFGVVKSVREKDGIAFVVFKCGGNWDLFNEYTGQSTRIEDLGEGWSGSFTNNRGEQFFFVDQKVTDEKTFLSEKMKDTFNKAGLQDFL